MRKRSRGDRLTTGIATALICAIGLMCLYPLLTTLMVSFSDETLVELGGYRLIPKKLTLSTYRFIFRGDASWVSQSYIMTVLVTSVGTVAALLVSSGLAYAMAGRKLKLRNAMAFFCYFTMVFYAGIVPFYVIAIRVYGFSDKIYAMILPYLVNVWFLFLLRNYFNSIPESIEESATIDGASHFTVFARIILPLAKVGLVTIGMFYALQFWNDWWLPLLFICSDEYFTLQFRLFAILSNVAALSEDQAQSVRMRVPTQTVKAAITIITIGPIIFLYPVFQRYFVKGIMVGGVKG